MLSLSSSSGHVAIDGEVEPIHRRALASMVFPDAIPVRGSHLALQVDYAACFQPNHQHLDNPHTKAGMIPVCSNQLSDGRHLAQSTPKPNLLRLDEVSRAPALAFCNLSSPVRRQVDFPRTHLVHPIKPKPKSYILSTNIGESEPVAASALCLVHSCVTYTYQFIARSDVTRWTDGTPHTSSYMDNLTRQIKRSR